MAQQYYGLPEDSISLFTAPASSATYPALVSDPTNSLALSPTTNVKLEPPAPSHTCGKPNLVQANQPNKRQKLADENSRHKFVSQRKWKFANGQTWISSKVSSKAQNASKVRIASKQESITPERLPSPLKDQSVFQLVSTTHSEQVPNNNRLGQHELPNQSGSDGGISGLLSTLADRKSRGHRKVPSQKPVQLSRPSKPSPSEHASSIESNRQTGHCDSRSLDLSTTAKPLVESSLMTNQTLSLEKDAERIAELIAKKRTENESNMFRERMLQRQQEHKSQKDPDKENEENPNNLPTDVVTSPETRPGFLDIHGKPLSNNLSLSSSPENTSSLASPVETTRTSVPKRRFQLPVTRSNTGLAAQPKAGFKEPRTVGIVTTTDDSASQSTDPTGYLENENSHGSYAMSRAATNPSSIGSLATMNTGPKTLTNTQENPSCEAEDAGFVAQLGPFTARTIPIEAGCDAVFGIGKPNQGTHWQQPGRQRVSPSSLQTLVSQRACSAGSVASESTTMSPTYFPSPTSPSYSQAPTNMAAHHFSHPVILPSHSQTATSNVATAKQYGLPQTKQSPVSLTNFPPTNSHTWQPGNFHGGHLDVVNYGSPLNLACERGVANRNPASSVQVRRAEPQTSKPGSNPNALRGNTRSGALHGGGLAPPKSRVNMFSKPKGAQFPMEEVIRQIEMT